MTYEKQRVITISIPTPTWDPLGVREKQQLYAKLQRKDFKWFLETVYPELHVPEDRPGFVRMLHSKRLKDDCFDYNPPNKHKLTGHRVLLYLCHRVGQNQFF